MHNAAFEALGLDWRYVKLPVAPAALEQTVRALPDSGYRGVNVTIPHKEGALALADEAGDAARAIGAANTLTFGDGAIRADNTDAGGLLAALGEEPRGMTALVLGAGGAGRAAAWALREAGAEVGVWNRTPERAARLADDLGVASVEAPSGADLVVNATSVGLAPGDAVEDLPLAWIDPPAVAVELVYGDHETPFQAWAEAGGSRVVDGLEVLVRQGALSFERWTGREAPLSVMRDAARGSGRT
ncbi:MAG: shikimate dehydrogenase [Thermoleophilaceae bacterium]|nr:shikimate dehydrogenase [Thermoleophilaceae bacterium]